ncbi:MAG: M14 family zinc carboxypeptidase [Actinomycetota bacterium]
MKRHRRLFAAGLVLACVGVLSPAASGHLGLLAPSIGTPDWGTGTARGPVKCTPDDITPDGRVFPEPQVSATFLTFSDFQCGIGVLEDLNPDRIDVEILGRSASDHPIYNVKVTNERIPEADKRHLFILNSIHGNEPAGREGAARVIEDMVDARFMANEDFIEETMDRFVVHFTFGNPDGWVNGDFHGHNDAGFVTTRANNGGRDLNRNFPVQGFLRSSNGTLDQTEGRGINELFLRHADTEHDVDDPANRGWYLGTDNHGQGAKPVAASGLQIVGQFDYQKSERLAHFADGIEGAMSEYGVLDVLQQLNDLTDGAVRPYEWGTLYDILGYSASGSGIDYYNTPGVVDGTGFATEMTASNAPYNFASHPHLLNQMWVNSVRAINYTMMRDAVDPPAYTFPIGGKAAYVSDPAVVTDSDDNGFGPGNDEIPAQFTGDDPEVDPDFKFKSYSVTRMRFFEDLNKHASEPLEALRVPDVLEDPSLLDGLDSIVLADNTMPEGSDRGAWVAVLKDFVEGGGNLIVTDAAAPVIADLVDGIEPTHITMQKSNVGFVDFPDDRSHPLNTGLRGVASQTYDVIPIGLPDGGGAAPNWRVNTAAWTAAGGTTTGTMGGQTAYGELPVGEGRIRFLGALLPQPSEQYFHPYGLQNYAVTYTGYTLLQNMLRWPTPSPEG